MPPNWGKSVFIHLLESQKNLYSVSWEKSDRS